MPLPELKPLPAPLTIAPLLIKVPLAAVALLPNAVVPPCAPLTVAALFVKTPLAAVEVVVEIREALIASELATNRAAVVDKRAVTRGRAVVE